MALQLTAEQQEALRRTPDDLWLPSRAIYWVAVLKQLVTLGLVEVRKRHARTCGMYADGVTVNQTERCGCNGRPQYRRTPAGSGLIAEVGR